MGGRTPLTHRTENAEQTHELGRRVAARLTRGQILLVSGVIGAGKTVLAQGIAAGLGVRAMVTSPTFTIVNEYEGSTAFVHVDLYRVSSDEEFDQLGLDDAIPDAVTVIEWPEHVPALDRMNAFVVRITLLSDGGRDVTLPDEIDPDARA